MMNESMLNSENRRKKEYVSPKMKLLQLNREISRLQGSLLDPFSFSGEGN